MAMAYEEAKKHVEGLPEYVKSVELGKRRFKQSDFVVNAFKDDKPKETSSSEETVMYGMDCHVKIVDFNKDTYKISEFAEKENLKLEPSKNAFRLVLRLPKQPEEKTVAYLTENQFFAENSKLFEKIGTEIYGLKATD